MNFSQSTVSPDIWKVISDPKRLKVLNQIGAIDGGPDAEFDHVTRLAARIAGAPIAMISLVGEDREWFRSCHGFTQQSLPLAMSVCAHALGDESIRVLTVLDATKDVRFRDHPYVTGGLRLRYCAAAPIRVHGQRVGSLCVLSSDPRTETDPALEDSLCDLAELAASLFLLKEEERQRGRVTRALMREETRHALTLEAGHVGSWIWSVESGRLTCNDIMLEMLGYEGEGAVYVDQLFDHVHPGDLPALRAAFQEALTDGVDLSCEFRASGTDRRLSARGRVLEWKDGGGARTMMGVIYDVTAARQAADNTKLLLREVNHRVKNTLALLQSVARQTLRQSADPAEFLSAFTARLRSIANAHTLLSDNEWSGIELHDLVETQVTPYAAKGQLELIGEDVPLPPDQALGLGMLLHEMATNAARYGALSQSSGKVTISAEVDRGAGETLRLVWSERGGPPVIEPVQKGFGSVMIERSLDKILSSSVDLTYEPEGVMVRVILPIGRRAAEPIATRANG